MQYGAIPTKASCDVHLPVVWMVRGGQVVKLVPGEILGRGRVVRERRASGFREHGSSHLRRSRECLGCVRER